MMKKIISVLSILMVCQLGLDAQSLLEKMKERAKETVEQNLGNKVEQGINDVLNGKKKDKGKKQETAEEAEAAQPEEGAQDTKKAPANGKTLSATYANSDFVPGDEIIFDDDVEREQLGEFPSMWDLRNGSGAAVITIDGAKAISLPEAGGESTDIIPLMEEAAFLPDVFTIEFDVYYYPGEDYTGDNFEKNNELQLLLGTAKEHEEWMGIQLIPDRTNENESNVRVRYYTKSPSGDNREGEAYQPAIEAGWNHFALSFNKRALKFYINGIRAVNVPNSYAPNMVFFRSDRQYYGNGVSNPLGTPIKNIRIAQGAVPLYDRLQSEGKIVTYAITFDVGKATIKPESFGEIARITKLMTDDPSLKFEVQGHCDNTGSAAVNDKLSQERAEAIMGALVQNGIDASRLSAVGKGSHEPIADNGTDEGRAKNRRVEFVKK